ncbi:hypothetical protein [Microbulbifer sp. ALW1]|uniref:hypothetical protein n=1 Tax=Microbulbifer sp. (strain ALW1) TaxID=1516059 RepID=UPI00135AF812|nr:hypothetical protein [Microbulbifer sp. ALW1]
MSQSIPTSLLRAFLPLVLICVVLLMSGCGGGGGGDEDRSSTSSGNADPGQAPPPSYEPPPSDSNTGTGSPSLSPGDYASIQNCPLVGGSSAAEFKLLFINLDSAPYFDEIVSDAIENQFGALAPFVDYFSHFGFYTLETEGQANLGCEKGQDEAAFSCDNSKIHQAIAEQCEVDDMQGIIKVVIADMGYGASGGEIIYLGSDRSWPDSSYALQQLRNIVVHEVAHNFGLADLYDGGINTDGSAVAGWPSEMSRQWANLDGPGCSKWCNNYKPASEYTQSANASCATFTDRASCTSFNRTDAGECKTADGDSYACCAWSEDTTDDYFGSQCTPVWGTEDIGQDCLEGTGCFYGGAYGNNSWRPVKTWDDSIMYGAGHSEAFDTVSEQALREAIRCCGTSDDSTASCSAFRETFNNFLLEYQPYKSRIGSCGTR